MKSLTDPLSIKMGATELLKLIFTNDEIYCVDCNQDRIIVVRTFKDSIRGKY